MCVHVYKASDISNYAPATGNAYILPSSFQHFVKRRKTRARAVDYNITTCRLILIRKLFHMALDMHQIPCI